MSRRSFKKISGARNLIWPGLILILLFNFAVRWRLRDMALERDEGEYAYAGQLILQGIPPYQLADNMKFPGVYFAYGFLMAIFGESPAGIHIGLILVTSLTALLVFLIGRKLLNALGGLMAVAAYVCLSLLPSAYGLAGHATHFVALFVCAGIFALLKAEEKLSRLWCGISGIMFGAAVLMVQHAALFPPFALAWIVWRIFRRENSSWQKPALMGLIFCAGCAAPLLVTGIGLACAGVWKSFVFWTFKYAWQYVTIFPLRAAWNQFAAGFGPVFESSAWVWLLGIAGLIFILIGKQIFRRIELIALLFVVGMLATCPGFYFRGHYFLLVMPQLALLAAAAVLTLAEGIKKIGWTRWQNILPIGLFCLALGNLVAKNETPWFRLTPYEISRQIYGTNPFPESAAVAAYLKKHTSPDEIIAVLGSEPQIFFLAGRHSASGYIYLYSLTEPQPLAPKMRKQFIGEIETARPKYVVFVNQLSSWYSTIVPDDPSQAAYSIPNWWNDYSQNYKLVGAVDISGNEPSKFYWDEQLMNRTNSSPPTISIFCRK